MKTFRAWPLLLLVAQVMLVQAASAQNVQPVNKDKLVATPSAEAMAYCQDVESRGIPPSHSAFNSLPVLQGVLGRLGYALSKDRSDFDAPPEIIAAVLNSKVNVIVTPQHGTVARLSSNSYFWQYTPEPGYVGKDKVAFLVEYQGRHFKIVVNLLVHETVPEDFNAPFGTAPACEKVFRPGSSLNETNTDQTAMLARSLSGEVAVTPGGTVRIVDLPNGALGQTTDQSITLDDNATKKGARLDF